MDKDRHAEREKQIKELKLRKGDYMGDYDTKLASLTSELDRLNWRSKLYHLTSRIKDPKSRIRVNQLVDEAESKSPADGLAFVEQQLDLLRRTVVDPEKVTTFDITGNHLLKQYNRHRDEMKALN